MTPVVLDASAGVEWLLLTDIGRRVDLAITLAGRTIKSSYTPSPNLYTTFAWDGRDAAGARLSPGLYFARARVRGAEAVQRVVLTP